MGTQSIPSADKISAGDFAAYLTRYDQCLEAISNSKASKPGEKSLRELDKYRYGVAIAEFSGEKPKKQMGLDDVKTLVNWKLRHGKFRPTLMKLVSSNDPSLVKEIVQEASKSYRENANISAALNILTKIKGIGPATASLLLAVHDPDNIMFFADEAFYWLCCGGKKDSIKYNVKEYKELTERAHEVCQRLSVRAVDVERVAFVILRQKDVHLPTAEPVQTQKETEKELNAKPKTKQTEKKPAKRKAVSVVDDQEAEAKVLDPPPGRRSKRVQRAKQA